jgi:hypothetical protein
MNEETKVMVIGFGALIVGTALLMRYNSKNNVSKEDENIMVQSCYNAAKEKGMNEDNPMFEKSIQDCVAFMSSEEQG